ncbi:hypothetical protein HaLaN_04331 [Haematococcus lacustris]|uniref:Uncharacterized protein n=1 Tax=Haematococcus lacustris TaxID=44745 RepID=A0A699YGH2_HAELA|nr:hypothetical protein HaLaN_04331 [Haematococcus lacustris]
MASSRAGSGLDIQHHHELQACNVAADLVSGLCKCVLNAYVNKINLEVLRDQCVDLLDLVLHLGHIGAFISTSRSSSEPLKLPPQFAKLMHRFNALEVIHYCKRYTREGMMAAEGKLFLETQHKQLYDELVTELRILARDALDQEDQEEVLKEVLDNCGRVNYGGDLPFVLDKKLEIYRDRLIAQDYSMFIHQPHLRAMWRKFLRHQQTVSAGWDHSSKVQSGRANRSDDTSQHLPHQPVKAKSKDPLTWGGFLSVWSYVPMHMAWAPSTYTIA